MRNLCLLLYLLCMENAWAAKDIVIEGGTGPTEALEPSGEPDIVIEGAGSNETQPRVESAATLAKFVDCAQEASLRSTASDRATRIKFVNETATERRTYWIAYDGKRVFYATLAPGESYTQQTYVTHPWIITDASEQCLAIYFPEAEPRSLLMP